MRGGACEIKYGLRGLQKVGSRELPRRTKVLLVAGQESGGCHVLGTGRSAPKAARGNQWGLTYRMHITWTVPLSSAFQNANPAVHYAI